MKGITRASFYVFIFTICINLLIIFKLMSVYFGNNPLNNSPRQSISYVSIFPEGWAFFTKSAKEPRIHIYNCNNNKIEYVDIRKICYSSDDSLLWKIVSILFYIAIVLFAAYILWSNVKYSFLGITWFLSSILLASSYFIWIKNLSFRLQDS